MFFRQTPVMLARGVGDISLYNIASYMTLNKHNPASDVGIHQAERSIRIRIKTNGKVL
jgi:hypothetical protein